MTASAPACPRAIAPAVLDAGAFFFQAPATAGAALSRIFLTAARKRRASSGGALRFECVAQISTLAPGAIGRSTMLSV